MPPRRILPSLLNRFQDLLNRTTQTFGHSPTLQPRYTGLRNAMSVRIVMWTDLVSGAKLLSPDGARFRDVSKSLERMLNTELWLGIGFFDVGVFLPGAGRLNLPGESP